MKKIYLLRHGQSEGNNTGIIQGTVDTALTEKGKEQAVVTAERLKGLKIDKIYCSQLSRAKDTAEIIGEHLDIEVEAVPEFCELSFGIWEGMDFELVRKNHKDDFELWKKSPHEFNRDGFEGVQGGKERMLKGLKRIEEKDDCENILIVSHGSSIKCLIIGLIEAENSLYRHMVMSNTGLSLLEIGDYNTIIRFYNDYSHLSNLE